MVSLLKPEDGYRLAKQVTTQSPPGSLLLLSGPLGVGKTTFMQQLGRAVGSEAIISSPSYTLIHEYPSPEGLLVHIDAYRLPHARLLLDMGLEDYLDRARLVVVEWGEALRDIFPEAIWLEFAFSDDGRRVNWHAAPVN